MHAHTALTYRAQQRWHSKQTNTARVVRNRASPIRQSQVDGEGARVDDTASALWRSLADQEATRRIREEQALPIDRIHLACGVALFVHGPILPFSLRSILPFGYPQILAAIWANPAPLSSSALPLPLPARRSRRLNRLRVPPG